MKSLLILRNLQVENANAVAGLTYGFPAIHGFLGFVHALSRTLQKDHGLSLGGCAVVCHRHKVQTFQPKGWGDHAFSLTRNPLTKEGNSPSFVEEGRMHMEVSLVIECGFSASKLDFGDDGQGGQGGQDVALFEAYIQNKVLALRLAGGTIQAMRRKRPVEFLAVPEDRAKIRTFCRKQMLRLLPGFALVCRPDLLQDHFQTLRAEQPDAELIDAWLDFAALKYRAEPNNSTNNAPNSTAGSAPNPPEQAQRPTTWARVDKPGDGWLVPLAAGFRAISPLHPPGTVANARDAQVPFRFVESAYTIGQWISPHRVEELEQLFWHHQVDGDWYLCHNNYQPGQAEPEPEPDPEHEPENLE